MPLLTDISVASRRRKKTRNVARDAMAEAQSNGTAARGTGPEASVLIAATVVPPDEAVAPKWILMRQIDARLLRKGNAIIVSRRWRRTSLPMTVVDFHHRPAESESAIETGTESVIGIANTETEIETTTVLVLAATMTLTTIVSVATGKRNVSEFIDAG